MIIRVPKVAVTVDPGLCCCLLRLLQAALLAGRTNKALVGREEFSAAVLRSVAGIEKKRSILQGMEKEVVARHEVRHLRCCPKAAAVAQSITCYIVQEQHMLNVKEWCEGSVQGCRAAACSVCTLYRENSIRVGFAVALCSAQQLETCLICVMLCWPLCRWAMRW
jgi:hypothetical protein